MSRMTEIIPEELDLFSEQPSLLSVLDSTMVGYSPLHSLDSDYLEFDIIGNLERLKKLDEIYLKLQVQLVKQDGTSFKEGEKIGEALLEQPYFVNNTIAALFKSVIVTLNGQQVRNIDSNYAIKDYIEVNINNDFDAGERKLGTQNFVPNGKIETLKANCQNSRKMYLYGKLNLINVSKLLLPMVTVNIKMHFASPDTYIIENISKSGTTSKMRLLDAKLYIKHCTVRESLLLAQEKMLASGRNAIYQFSKGDILVHNVSSNSNSISIQSFYSGPRPSLLICAMTENESLIGSRMKDLYTFNHFDIRSFSFVVDGKKIPQTPYEIDISTGNYTEVFARFFEALSFSTKRTNLVTLENYKNTHFFIAEDVTSFSTALTNLSQPTDHCTVGIEASFSKALSKTISVVLYIVTQGRFEVTANRNIVNIQ
jgi:hypothetical protein